MSDGINDLTRNTGLVERDSYVPRLATAYVAHKLGSGPDREQNRKRAAIWCGWLAERYLCAPVCTWITLAEVWPETMRDIGLEVDRALVEMVGLVVACGPEMSRGMRFECGWASDVIDVTWFCCELPEMLSPGELEWIDAEMALRGIGRRNG